jgi:hypothetical protein
MVAAASVLPQHAQKFSLLAQIILRRLRRVGKPARHFFAIFPRLKFLRMRRGLALALNLCSFSVSRQYGLSDMRTDHATGGTRKTPVQTREENNLLIVKDSLLFGNGKTATCAKHVPAIPSRRALIAKGARHNLRKKFIGYVLDSTEKIIAPLGCVK